MPTNNAKFTFIYMLSLVALVFAAVSSGMILFQLINKYISDPASSAFSQEPVKFAIAAILVAAPLYYWTVHFLNKSLVSGVLEKTAPSRRWLTYLILFVAAVIVLGWLIGTLNVLLSGELTTRFVLKLLTVIVLAGLAFSYYYWDSRREIKASDQMNKVFLAASLVVVVVSFSLAWLVIDSPKVSRARRMDQNIVNELSQIDSAISNYYNINNKLPANLKELVDNRSLLQGSLTDDQGNAYEYQITGDKTYKICADFLEETQTIGKGAIYDYPIDPRWQHGAGYQCLEQTVINIAQPVKY